MASASPEVKVTRNPEIPEHIMPIVKKHDDLVLSEIEEEQRLLHIRSKRIELQNKKKDLELLMGVVLHGGRIDRETYSRLKPLIAEVDQTIQQIVTDCLAPCVANDFTMVEET